MKVVCDLVLEWFQWLDALDEHGVDCVKAEEVGLKLQVHNGRTNLLNIYPHLEHVERKEDGLLPEKDSASVWLASPVFSRSIAHIAVQIAGLYAAIFVSFTLLLIALWQVVLSVPLMIVQPVDQIVQPFVIANVGTVDHATAMNCVQVTCVCSVLGDLLEMTGDDVLCAAHELPLVCANLLDRLRKPAGWLAVRMVPHIDETVQLPHLMSSYRGTFRYFCSNREAYTNILVF